MLKGRSGKTFVYIFSDGGYDSTAGTTSPGDKTAALAKNHDVCFQVIDYAAQERDRKTVSDMSRANMCSRVIPFDSYVTQPYYGIGPLYYTKWDTEVVTTSETKVAGYKVDNILFDFNKSDLSSAAQEELDKVGKFLVDKPSASSRCSVTPTIPASRSTTWNCPGVEPRQWRILSKNFNLGADRVVALWYGAENPIASNNTDEGRAKNRRVEISIGGL